MKDLFSNLSVVYTIFSLGRLRVQLILTKMEHLSATFLYFLKQRPLGKMKQWIIKPCIGEITHNMYTMCKE